MDRATIDALVREQFRLDTNCRLEDEEEKYININEARAAQGARYYDDLTPFFRAIIYHGEMYMCADPSIIDWCKGKYALSKPEWFCKYENLRELDLKLKESGHEIKDTHVYFLPDHSFEGYEFETPYKVTWYDEREIMAFKEENPFKHALGFIPDAPDVVAVSASDGDKIIAMAGASLDGRNMWQIGIDVTPEYEGHGLAVYLVTMLKDRIMDMGKVPFYGTSESHSNSMDVAIRSGFIPAFTEVFCHRLK